MIMLATVAALSVDALNTLSSSSDLGAFSSAVSMLTDGSSAIFLQNSAAGQH